MNEMKILEVGEEEYEIVDEKARNEKLDNFSSSNQVNLGSELLTNESLWETNEGWNGNASSGFAHVVGSSSSLVYNHEFEANKNYIVDFDVETTEPAGTDGPSNDFTVILGDTEPIITYRGGGSMHYTIALKPTTAGKLQFLCRSHANPYTEVTTFIGTIKNISLKLVEGNIAPLIIKDGNQNNSLPFAIMLNKNQSVAIGLNAGISNYSQNKNVYVGCESGKSDITGYFNTGIGADTLSNVINGSRNTAIGKSALNNVTSGDRNTAIGTFAMSGNKTGRKNVAIGFDTMMSLTQGEDNIAIGNQAIISAKNSTNNIAIGTHALAGGVLNGGNENIAIGKATQYFNVSGTRNIAIGNNALYRNVSGANNIAIGNGALNDMTSLRGMVAIGRVALNKVTTGGYAVVIGDDMNHGNLTNAERSVAVGSVLLKDMTSLKQSVLMGYNIVGNGTKTTFENVIAINTGRRTLTLTRDNFVNIANALVIDTFTVGTEKVGIGTLTPSARLHLASQTADSNSAPIKLTANTSLMNYKEDGAFEYDGTHLYFTIGNERKTII